MAQIRARREPPRPELGKTKPRNTIEGLQQRLARGVQLTDAEVKRLVDHRIEQRIEGRHRYELHKQLRNHWLRRLLGSKRPLEEKMTLFWHSHFATSMAKVRNSEYMIRQNALLRAHATGNFGRLVRAIAVDPAMLVYLDGVGSHKGRPNENFARELLELYTIGIGQYSERDVAEAARAFTGWTWNEPVHRVLFQQRTMSFVRANHDDGPKSFLGRKGRWTGEDVIRITLARPQAARFVCAKLCRFFLGLRPAKPIVESLAATLRDSGYEIRPVLKRLFRSRLFYDSRTIGIRIKSPVELIVGTLRTLGVRAEDLSEDPEGARMLALDDLMGQMGQRLLFPPSVKGWEGGKLWITAGTTIVRYDVVRRLVFMTPVGRPRMDMQQPPTLIRASERKRLLDQLTRFEDAESLLDHLIARILPRPLPRDRRARLLRVLAPAGAAFDAGSAATRKRLLQVLLLLMSTPEYQLC